MTNIKIKLISEDEKEWKYNVDIDSDSSKSSHQIILTKDYYHLLAEDQAITPDLLVKKSVEFLLERESKESILPAFDLKIINNYFPEYEDEIKERW